VIRSNVLRTWGRLAALTAILMMGGCAAVGPDYEMPDKQVSSQWHAPFDRGLANEPVDQEALSHWWRTLNDPALSRLMDEAVAGNLDLKEARARVREARARRGIEEAGLFPDVDASGKIIRANGGVFENEVVSDVSGKPVSRYWITLDGSPGGKTPQDPQH